MNLYYFKIYRVYLASLNSVKWSRIFAEVELWMTVSKLKTAGFVQSLGFLKKSRNLPSNFPDLGKVWKIEVKSWLNGKKSWVFFESRTKSPSEVKSFLFYQILFNLACMSWKKLFSCVFLRSLLITYLINSCLHGCKKSLDEVLSFGSKSVRTLYSGYRHEIWYLVW